MRRTLLVLGLSLAATPAFAHLDPAAHGSFAAGFSHPFFGLDHLLAMVGVGLWASLLGGRAVWAVPAAFVGAMVLGFAAAIAGLGLPFVEPVVGASVVVLGLAALVALRAPTGWAAGLVGFFALFHGFAHGGELGAAGAWAFAGGFAVATALLQGTGVALGVVLGRLSGRIGARALGGLTALGGLWVLAGG